MHTISYRVYYEDTDAGGIVYHANYLKFAERARTEWLRELGFEQSKLLKENGVFFAVHQLQIAYHAPAKLDDLLTIETHLENAKKVSFQMNQVIKCGTTKIATLSVSIASIDAQGKPCRIPPKLLDVFAKE